MNFLLYWQSPATIKRTGGGFMGQKDLEEKNLLSSPEVFADVINVLLGEGEETVGVLMNQYFKSDKPKWLTVSFDNAHNEFLQYLITQGLIGLLSYLFFVGNAVKSGFKEGSRYQQAAALACVCYLAQSVLNISQSITTPLFFVFLALTQTQALAPAQGQISALSKK